MTFLQSFSRVKNSRFNITNPARFYFYLALFVFIIYTTIDFINTNIFMFYPIYHSVYAQGSADSIYFTRAVDKLLSFKIPTGNFDGGLLAIMIYIIPVSFSNIFHSNIGFSFRVFYLIILLLTGYGILLVGSELYSEQTGLYLSISFIFNPFIFILSVWAGSEEIIEALFFVIILYFVIRNRQNYALLLTLISCFYKYYSILLIPFIILSYKDSRTKIKVTAILTGFFAVAGIFIFIFLNKYIMNVINVFIDTFHLHGKGVFYLLVQYEKISQIAQPFGFLYYSLIGIVILLFIWLTRNSEEPFKYGIIFIIFFFLYPEYYSSYLIIPLVAITLLFPKVGPHMRVVTIGLLPIASAMSEFAFTLVDSPYNLYHITPTPLSLDIGLVFLFLLYAIMIYWIITYFKLIHNSDSQLNNLKE